MSNTMIILLPILIGVVLAGILAFVLRGSGGSKVAATRLDILVGKKPAASGPAASKSRAGARR